MGYIETIPFEEVELEWWGYIHKNGIPQAKRYFGTEDINEAHESPFVEFTSGPFMAKNREDAITKLINNALAEGYTQR